MNQNTVLNFLHNFYEWGAEHRNGESRMFNAFTERFTSKPEINEINRAPSYNIFVHDAQILIKNYFPFFGPAATFTCYAILLKKLENQESRTDPMNQAKQLGNCAFNSGRCTDHHQVEGGYILSSSPT